MHIYLKTCKIKKKIISCLSLWGEGWTRQGQSKLVGGGLPFSHPLPGMRKVPSPQTSRFGEAGYPDIPSSLPTLPSITSQPTISWHFQLVDSSKTFWSWPVCVFSGWHGKRKKDKNEEEFYFPPALAGVGSCLLEAFQEDLSVLLFFLGDVRGEQFIRQS